MADKTRDFAYEAKDKTIDAEATMGDKAMEGVDKAKDVAGSVYEKTSEVAWIKKFTLWREKVPFFPLLFPIGIINIEKS